MKKRNLAAVLAVFCLVAVVLFWKRERVLTAEYGHFTVLYTESCAEQVEPLAQYLTEHEKAVYEFFESDGPKRRIQIVVYPTVRAWKHSLGLMYRDWIVGVTHKDTVSVLSYDAYAALRPHQEDRFEDFLRVVLHEFVHVCDYQQRTGNDVAFFTEGLAAYLADQYSWENPDLKSIPPDTLFDGKEFRKLENQYPVARKAVQILMERMERNEFLLYVRNPQLLLEHKSHITAILYS